MRSAASGYIQQTKGADSARQARDTTTDLNGLWKLHLACKIILGASTPPKVHPQKRMPPVDIPSISGTLRTRAILHRCSGPHSVSGDKYSILG